MADTVAQELPPMQNWGEITYAQRAAIDLASQMVLGNGEFDVYLPTQAHVRLFRALTSGVDDVLHEVAGSELPEYRLFSRLLERQLPDVEHWDALMAGSGSIYRAR